MRYNEQGGMAKMDFDVAVAAEMSERLTEQHEKARARTGSSRAGRGSQGADAAINRRNKRREARQEMTGGELGKLLQDTFNNKKTGGGE